MINTAIYWNEPFRFDPVSGLTITILQLFKSFYIESMPIFTLLGSIIQTNICMSIFYFWNSSFSYYLLLLISLLILILRWILNPATIHDKSYIQVEHLLNHWVCITNYNPWDKNNPLGIWHLYDSIQCPEKIYTVSK